MHGSRMHRLSVLFSVITAITIGCLPAFGRAQEKSNSKESTLVPANSELTIESIQARVKALDENKELDPAVKTRLTEVYSKTLEHLRAAAESVARSEQQAKLIREAPETLETLRAELAVPPSDKPPEVPADATLVQVQQMLSRVEIELTDAQKSLQTLQDEPKRRADRRLEIPKLADANKLQIQELDKQLELKPSPDEPAELSVATKLLLEARKKAIATETAARQQELQLFEATGELLSTQRDKAARRLAEFENQVKALRTIVNDKRRQEAERQAQEAHRTSAQAHPAVRKVAEQNADLAKLRQALAGKIEQTARELEQMDQQVTTLEEQFKKITKRFETAGGTEAIGLLLRKQRDELPDARVHERKIQQRTAEISSTYLELIEYEEKRNELATLDPHVNEILKDLDATGADSALDFLEEEVRSVLQAQRAVYDSLISDTNSFLDKLVELDLHERQLITKADEFAKYCDERILWIRSATVFGWSHLKQLGVSVAWLIDPRGWREIGSTLWGDVVNQPVPTAFAALILLILMLVQRPLRTSIGAHGKQAERSNITSYLPTLHAFVATGLLALLWPGLIGYLGLRLVAAEGGSEFVAAFGWGLEVTAVVFMTLELLRQVCRRGGMGEAHFDWDVHTTRQVRKTLWWFIVCSLPFNLIVSMTESQSSELIKNSLGRLAFVGWLTVLTLCAHRLLRSSGGAFEKTYAATPEAWTSRLQRAWHMLAVGAPIALGILAFGGYYYTALELASRLLATCWLAIGLLIMHAALIRWSLLSYRSLAMRKARERRAAAEAAATASGSAGQPAAAVVNIQPEVKLSDINKQTRKALQLTMGVGLVAGLWLVWIDVLPALGALRHVELWMVEATSTTGAVTTTVLQPITLANVLLAIVLAFLTIAAGRNLPGLLEIAVLQRLPLDPGVRYAITTVCQYAITAAGLVGAFGAIGIGWSKVQWLVAAISVGLGFGLQEIFANFVSGLILLFERPVRLGDIVTVGEVTGHVTRIQMRATTITDWDMRELVVPNKEFITDRVMNWTLSNTTSRMSVTVGVAYGTDPDLVRSLLLQVATRNSLVSKEIPPHALFDQFGDSTLNFVLRVYMASRDVFLQLRHELYSEIAREFQKAGIEIAFPQRDIHIRTARASASTFEQDVEADDHEDSTSGQRRPPDGRGSR